MNKTGAVSDHIPDLETGFSQLYDAEQPLYKQMHVAALLSSINDGKKYKAAIAGTLTIEKSNKHGKV